MLQKILLAGFFIACGIGCVALSGIEFWSAKEVITGKY